MIDGIFKEKSTKNKFMGQKLLRRCVMFLKKKHNDYRITVISNLSFVEIFPKIHLDKDQKESS